jgi:hypothetical protein
MKAALIILMIVFSQQAFSQVDSATKAILKRNRTNSNIKSIAGTTLIIGGSLSVAVAGFGYLFTGLATDVVTGDPSAADYSFFKTLALAGLAGIGTGIVLVIDANKAHSIPRKLKINPTAIKIKNIKRVDYLLA